MFVYRWPLSTPEPSICARPARPAWQEHVRVLHEAHRAADHRPVARTQGGWWPAGRLVYTTKLAQFQTLEAFLDDCGFASCTAPLRSSS